MKTAALAFIAGALLANWSYRADLSAASRQIDALDAQLDSATEALEHAHATMDLMEGCSLRGAAPLTLAARTQGDRNE